VATVIARTHRRLASELLERLTAQQTFCRVGIASVVRDHCAIVLHRSGTNDRTSRV